MRLLLFTLLTGCAATIPPRPSTLREVTGCGTLGWPVEAQVSSGFGPRDARPHLGIDLPVPEGTLVLAACDGRVRSADDSLRGYGELVILEHADGLTTYYAHNQALLVHAGDLVSRGQPIARSGQTGHVTAPHVHFEVRADGRAIDPMLRLEPRLRLTVR